MLFVSRSCEFGGGMQAEGETRFGSKTNMSAGEHKSDPRTILTADGEPRFSALFRFVMAVLLIHFPRA